jgi:cobalamin biosynthesis protein CobT
VVGFTTGRGSGSSETPVKGIYYHRNIPLELIEIKPFSMTRRSDMLGRFYAAAAYQGGGTVEGEGVWWAAKRLALRKEQRKLLIVVCDGGPCGGPAPTWKFEEHAGEVVKRIREYGIETIHVGIGTNDPLRYVPEETFVRYDGLDDLLTGFYSRLGSILRGERRRNEEPVPVT